MCITPEFGLFYGVLYVNEVNKFKSNDVLRLVMNYFVKWLGKAEHISRT